MLNADDIKYLGLGYVNLVGQLVLVGEVSCGCGPCISVDSERS